MRQLLRKVLSDRLYTQLGIARDRLALARFHSYVATHRYGGYELSVHIGDEMARGWYDHDWPMMAEIATLAERGRLRAGARVFDIGAHQGVVAMILGRLVGEAGRVVAVEATPHNVAVARKNVAQNALAQVTVVHAAGADAPGVLQFSPRMNGHVAAADEASVDVRALTVDELTAEHGVPQVLFVDVEGYELHVLRGARRTLAEHRPDLFVEVHMGEGLERFGDADDVLALIPDGYDVLVSKTDAGPYLPLADGREILRGHSRLVALARSEGAAVA
ncbi:MAG TPA: FkbM family methyltransferase [Gemmatimonadaceae bacterium]|jgi:FkbM family methyltransferase|nr:FkbM family methyltransferase [Gemmatimonadaceae bacterium]